MTYSMLLSSCTVMLTSVSYCNIFKTKTVNLLLTNKTSDKKNTSKKIIELRCYQFLKLICSTQPPNPHISININTNTPKYTQAHIPTKYDEHSSTPNVKHVKIVQNKCWKVQFAITYSLLHQPIPNSLKMPHGHSFLEIMQFILETHRSQNC